MRWAKSICERAGVSWVYRGVAIVGEESTVLPRRGRVLATSE